MTKLMTDDELETQIKTLVGQEREILVQVLDLLREVESRRLYLKRSCGSLFEYCTKVLLYSEPAAARRINAMRLSREIPEVTDKVASGELSLSNVAAAHNFFRRQDFSSDEKREVLSQVEHKSRRECEKILVGLAAPETARPDRSRPLSDELTEIRFTASETLMKKFEKLKSLLSHQMPDPSYAQLFEFLADEVLKRKDPTLKITQKKSIKTPPNDLKTESTPPAESGHQISTKLRHKVWKRDGGCCQHEHCGSTYQLQIDHVVPVALGGKTELENLQLVCRQHNLLRAHDILGAQMMDQYWPRHF